MISAEYQIAYKVTKRYRKEGKCHQESRDLHEIDFKMNKDNHKL